MNNKILIAYFSRAGNNYAKGGVVDLPIGNTEVVAKTIAQLTGGDLFKIESVKKYPDDYNSCTEEARKELRENARPELVTYLDDFNEFGTIILGYPNWWSTMPMPVFTFLEACDFSDKTILPFCTHEGSELGDSVRNIAKLCPKAKIMNGLAIHGSHVNNAHEDVAEWLQKADLLAKNR